MPRIREKEARRRTDPAPRWSSPRLVGAARGRDNARPKEPRSWRNRSVHPRSSRTRRAGWSPSRATRSRGRPRELGVNPADAAGLAGQARADRAGRGCDRSPTATTPTSSRPQVRELERRVARLETEKEILKKATAFFASQSAVRFAWIDRHRGALPTVRASMCEVLGASAAAGTTPGRSVRPAAAGGSASPRAS